MAKFSPQELAEMAAADAEIERTFVLTKEEVLFSKKLDRMILESRMSSTELAIVNGKREWRRKNVDRSRASHRKWLAANRDRVNANKRAYYAAHKDEINRRRKELRALRKDVIS